MPKDGKYVDDNPATLSAGTAGPGNYIGARSSLHTSIFQDASAAHRGLEENSSPTRNSSRNFVSELPLETESGGMFKKQAAKTAFLLQDGEKEWGIARPERYIEAERYRQHAKKMDLRRVEAEATCEQLRQKLSSAEAKLYGAQHQKEQQDLQLAEAEERIDALLKQRATAAAEKTLQAREILRLRAELDTHKESSVKKEAALTLTRQELARTLQKASDTNLQLRGEIAEAKQDAELAHARTRQAEELKHAAQMDLDEFKVNACVIKRTTPHEPK